MQKIIQTSLFLIAFNSSFSQSLWEPKGEFLTGTESFEYFGSSSAITPNGNTIVIGAEGHNATEADAGQTTVYSWINGTWQQKGNGINGEDGNDFSGCSVDISNDGNTIIIGAYLNDGNGANGTSPGHIRVYTWNGTSWIQKGTDINGQVNGDYFGTSVSISADGNIIAAGADRNDSNGTDAGHVRVFQWDGNAWTQMGANINGEAASNYCGGAISLSDSGNEIAVGAFGNNGNNSGHVRVFQWDGMAWGIKGAEMNGEATNDFFGTALSLSADGNKLAVGAKGNNGGGSDAGHTRVFEWNGSTWVQKGIDIDGAAAGELSGASVSLANNGNTVAVWSKETDANGTFGRTRIFDWTGTTWQQRGININFNSYTTATVYTPHVRLTEDGNTFIGSNSVSLINGTSIGQARVYSCNRYEGVDLGTCDSLVSPSGTYTWNVAGVYSDTLISANNYDSIVYVNLSINSFDADIVQELDVLTTSIDNADYQWIDCNTQLAINGATNQTFTVQTNGTYAVIATRDGCVDTSACELVDDLNVSELETLFGAVYPNPNKGIFEINLSVPSRVIITDLNGTVLFRQELNSGKNNMTLPAFATGIYILNAQSGESIQTQKLIIE